MAYSIKSLTPQMVYKSTQTWPLSIWNDQGELIAPYPTEYQSIKRCSGKAFHERTLIRQAISILSRSSISTIDLDEAMNKINNISKQSTAFSDRVAWAWVIEAYKLYVDAENKSTAQLESRFCRLECASSKLLDAIDLSETTTQSRAHPAANAYMILLIAGVTQLLSIVKDRHVEITKTSTMVLKSRVTTALNYYQCRIAEGLFEHPPAADDPLIKLSKIAPYRSAHWRWLGRASLYTVGLSVALLFIIWWEHSSANNGDDFPCP